MVQFQETPVEAYTFAGRPVLVKREDQAALPPMPPLSKMRGVYAYLSRLGREGVRQVGVVDTRVSKSGLGAAILCEELGIACNYYFPLRRHEPWWTPYRDLARRHGASLIPVQAGRAAIVFSRIKKRETGCFCHRASRCMKRSWKRRR